MLVAGASKLLILIDFSVPSMSDSILFDKVNKIIETEAMCPFSNTGTSWLLFLFDLIDLIDWTRTLYCEQKQRPSLLLPPPGF